MINIVNSPTNLQLQLVLHEQLLLLQQQGVMLLLIFLRAQLIVVVVTVHGFGVLHN